MTGSRQANPARHSVSIEGVDAAYIGILNDAGEARLKSYKTRIEEKLTAAFAPDTLEVLDESANHAGHSGWREGGETHFRIRIKSQVFSGKSRIDIHRAVNAALSDELNERVHALVIEARAP